MCDVRFSIPSEILYDTRLTPDDVVILAKKSLALCLYVQNGVSLGYCAQIAGMDKEEFIKYLGANHISVFTFHDKAEFIEEMRNA